MSVVSDITPVSNRAVEEVVDALEDALAEARAGRIRNVAIVGEASSGNMYYTNWGLENNMLLLGHLSRLSHQIHAVMDCESGEAS